MTIAELLRDLERQQVELWAEGERLRYRAPGGVMTAELRDQLRAQKEAILAHLSAVGSDPQGPFPLSHGQRGLWFLHQLAPQSAAYNVGSAWRIPVAIDRPALRRAFDRLVERHPALRATFGSRDGEPFQQVGPAHADYFREWDASGASEDEIAQALAREVQRPFDLERGPVFRVGLVTVGPDSYVLHLTLHHIAGDFWSLMRLLVDLGRLYEAERTGRDLHLPPLPAQYADYVRWQADLLESHEGERLWAYWRDRLAGELPVLALHPDHPRPAVQTFRGRSHLRIVGEGLTSDLRALARRLNVTPFALLLSAYFVLLFRYTGQEDVIVGSPMAGRSRPEFESLVGYFINSVPLRASLSAGARFTDLLAQVRAEVLGALAHQDLPGTLMAERLRTARSAAQSSLFQTLFVLNRPHHLEHAVDIRAEQGAELRMDVNGLPMQFVPTSQRSAMMDLTLMTLDMGATLGTIWQYNDDLFDEATIVRMAEHYERLLRAIVADPERPIGDLPLVDAGERERLLALGDGPALAPGAGDRPVHELFEEQARRSPEAIAVEDGATALSYAELSRRSNQLARHLISRGVGPERTVVLCLDRSAELIVALLATLKAGGAYVPLDPEHPAERMAAVIDDVRPVIALTERRLASRLPAGTPTLLLDAESKAIAEHADGPVPPSARSANLAYLIYTSGSTGRPKGVAIEHRSLAAYTRSAIDMFGLTPADRVLQFASISFDAAAEEIYPTLASGGTLVLRGDAMVEGTRRFLRECRERRLTVLDLPTAFWHAIGAEMSDVAGEWPASVRLIIIGGERAAPDRLAAWRQRAPAHVRLVNTYGPTEATIVATACDISAGRDVPIAQEVPVGRPIAGVRACVLDDRLQLVPFGVPGELCLGGVGLARGYLNRPDLTADRFVADPFGAPGERLYRTGDLARLRVDGLFEVLGRIDSQVKLRGFRIELGDVEAALRRCPGVRDAAVLLHEDTHGQKQLVGYWVSDGATSSTSVRDFVKAHLPSYMVPILVPMPALPRTPNGKLARHSLPAPADTGASTDYVAPRPGLETLIATTWQQVLGVPRVGRHDNFFDLGGHSLLAMQVASRLSDSLQLRLPLRRLFEAATVSELAGAIDTLQGAVPGEPPALAVSDNREEIEL